MDRPGTGRRREGAALLACAGLAALVRVPLLASMGRVDPDAVVWFFPMARAILAGDLQGGFIPGFPPLYPCLVAGATALVGEVELGTRLVSVVSGVLTVLPVYALMRRLGGPGAGAAGAFLLAIHPLFARYSVIARAEVPVALWIATAAWLAVVAVEDRGFRTALGMGAASAIGFLVRPEALAVPVVALPWMLLARDGGPWRGRAARVAVAAAPLVVVLAGHSAWIQSRIGVWTLAPKLGIHMEYGEGGGGPTWWNLNEAGTEVRFIEEVEQGDYSSPGVLGRALAEPGATAARVGRNAFRFAAYLPEMIGYVNLLLLPFAVPALRDPARRRPLLLLGGVLVFTWLTLSLLHPARRMVVPFVPIALALPALGLAAIQDRRGPVGPDGRGRRHAVWALLVLAMIPFHIRTASKFGGYWSPERRAGVELGSLIEAATLRGTVPGHLSPETVPVMAFPIDLAHFAGARPVFFPRDTRTRTLAYAERKGVVFVIYDEREAVAKRPEFAVHPPAWKPVRGQRLLHTAGGVFRVLRF